VEAGTAALLLGSNGERRVAAIEAAVPFLAARGVEIVALSSFHASPPFGRGGQPWFLNRALLARTGLSPRALLAVAKEAEAAAGRTLSPRWGPRELDVDILLYGDAVVSDEGLTIPHAGLSSRRFALAPLFEVAPNAAVPPAGATVAALLAECKDETEVLKI
jgi:2-amino-4-hydroxy-6-hydroxymethyldihydropteridine diphosphokinase